LRLLGARCIRHISSQQLWQPVTSPGFRNVLALYGAIKSISGTGHCYDNARMERLFAAYNRERIYTGNLGGLAPAIYRQAARDRAA